CNTGGIFISPDADPGAQIYIEPCFFGLQPPFLTCAGTWKITFPPWIASQAWTGYHNSDSFVVGMPIPANTGGPRSGVIGVTLFDYYNPAFSVTTNIPVYQNSPLCSLTVPQATVTVPASGGAKSVQIDSTFSGCWWLCYYGAWSPPSSWIHSSSCSDQSTSVINLGSRAVTVTADANTQGATRQGWISFITSPPHYTWINVFQGPRSPGLTLLDPVPTLLDGPAVASSTALPGLVSQARVVNGVAADGAAQLVIQISGANPNENLSLKLDADGGLANIGTNLFKSTVTTQADSTGNGFVLYEAPDDFARAGTMSNSVASSRAVNLSLQSLDDPSFTATTPIVIVRPPIMLIHGFWGHPANWTPFVDNLYSLVGKPLPFGSFPIAYDDGLNSLPATLTGTQPALASQYLQSIQTKGDTSSLGVYFNAERILSQVVGYIQQFKTANSVAAVQADVISHSMGGLVTRALPQVPGYFADANFGTGLVHKLITIDTPHLGTPIANQFLSTGAPLGDNSCMRQYQASKGKLAASSATLTGLGTVNGALGDMIGDGFGNGLSPEVLSLQNGAATIPTAFIAGNGCGFVDCPFGPISSFLQAYLSIVPRCLNAPLVQALESFTWPLIFKQDSDAMVPLTSQSNSGRNG